MYIYIYIYTYIYIYNTYIHTYIHTYMPTHTHTHHKPFLLISNRKLATPSLSLSHIYTHTHIYIYIHIYNTYIHTCIHTHAHTHRVNPFPLFRTGNWLPHLPPPRRAQQTLQLRAITLTRKAGKIDKFPFHGHLQSTTLPFYFIFLFRRLATPSSSSTTSTTNSSTSGYNPSPKSRQNRQVSFSRSLAVDNVAIFYFFSGNWLPHLPSLRRAQQTLQLRLLLRRHHERIHVRRASLQRLRPSRTPLLASLAFAFGTRRRPRIGGARIPRCESLYMWHT